NSSKRFSRDGEQSKRTPFNKDKNTTSRSKKSDAGTDRPARSYGADNAGRKPYGTGEGRGKTEGSSDRPFKKFEKRGGDDSRSAGRSGARREEGAERKPFRSRSGDDNGFNKRSNDRPTGDRP